MKKILIGLIIGLMVAIPASVSADYIVHTTHWTNIIYKSSGQDGDIAVFDDAGNKCYVVTSNMSGYAGGNLNSISCVKQ